MRRLAVIGASRLATSVPDLGPATNIERRESDWGLQLRCSVCGLALVLRHYWDLWLLLQFTSRSPWLRQRFRLALDASHSLAELRDPTPRAGCTLTKGVGTNCQKA